MAIEQIVGCTPWRLLQPRPFTDYEWGVVHTCIAGQASGRLQPAEFFGSQAETMALVTAIRQQSCAAWKGTAFGPAPAVDTRWFKALATWYWGLPLAQRATVPGQIMSGLLCGQATPWAMPIVTGKGPGEYAPQLSDFPAVDACSDSRKRTMYAPMTGREMMNLFKLLDPQHQLPPQLVQIAAMAPAMFLDRDFIVGIQLKPLDNLPGFLGTMGQWTQMPSATAVVDDVALIWAPGKGASVLNLISGGPIDMNAVAALITQMAPDLLGGLGAIPGLAQALPGLLQQYAGPLATVFGSTQQKPTPNFSPSPSPAPVGNKLADTPAPVLGSMRDPAPPLPAGSKIVDTGAPVGAEPPPGADSSPWPVIAAVGAAVVVAALVMRSRD